MKKRYKIMVSLAVALCLVVGVPAGALAIAEGLPVTVEDASKADVDVRWYTDDPGQEEYFISTAAQLRGLAALVNGTAKDAKGLPIDAVSFEKTTIYQTASIDLSDISMSGRSVYEWQPIGTADHSFAGIYQAYADKTIKGLYLSKTYENAGLFGYCSAGSALNNVSVRNGSGGQIHLETSTERIRNVGSLVGYTAGAISSCYSDMTVMLASVGEDISTVEDPYSLRWVGGVAGYALGNLSNTGFGGMLDVKIASNAPAPDTSSESLCVGQGVGGVVGRYGDPNNHGSITECTNRGTVFTRTTGTASTDRFGTTTYANLFFVGGVAGYSNGSISNCTNGKFTYLTGEVDGIVSTSAADVPDGTPLNNRGADQAGGICGGLRSVSDVEGRYNDGDPNDPMLVYDCHNYGHVTGSCACGGIIGEAGSYCTISACSNGLPDDTSQSAGKVISARWNKPISAGILGISHGSNVSYCANYAEIRNIQTGYYMAGICGALFVSDDYPDLLPELYACYNTGGVFTINTSEATEYREAGICGQNEGFIHDCLNTEGTVPYHGNAIIGADDWGMWSNLEVRSRADMQTSDSAAFLNAVAGQNQDWKCYWFMEGSGLPTLNLWANLSESERTVLSSDNIQSIVCLENAPYVGGEGGSLPTLKITLASGQVLVQNTDFYAVAQPGAVEMSSGGAYKASIGGLGMYRGYVAECASYDIGAADLSKANMVIESTSYNGGRVILPTSIQVCMGTSVIEASNYDYIIYSRRVSNTMVQQESSGCTEVYDSLGYISYREDGSDKMPVSSISIDDINAETRAYWLWNRSEELISNSAGDVYYTITSGGGTPGKIVDAKESCVSQRSGSPAGFVIQASATKDNPKVSGSVIGNYSIDPVDLMRECTFNGVECDGKTWYWDADKQAFYELDEHGERIVGMPATTFTGDTIEPVATISCTLADGTPYTLIAETDYRVVNGDPDVEEEYANRNVTDYSAETPIRACMTIRPVDTSCFSNYLVAFFGVAPAKLEDCSISIASDEWAYSGDPIEPPVSVDLNGIGLIEGVDYTVSYADNIEKGKASYTVTALDNLEGGKTSSYTGYFTISEGKSLGDLSIDKIADQQFNYGYDVHPNLVFRDSKGSEVKLIEGEQYSVSYSTTDVTKCIAKNPDGGSINYQVEKCTATITGVGMYTGSLTTQFDIVPYDAAANSTNQLRAMLQPLALASWKDEQNLPFNVGLNNPIINVCAYPIVDWAAYGAGDFEAAYGTPVVIGNSNNQIYGSTINNRPARYYVYDATAEGGLGTLVSCDGATISSPYETGQGTTLATKKAPANTLLVATVAMRVSTNSSGLHNGAIGLLKTKTFEVSAPVSFAFSAGEGEGTLPSLDDAAVGEEVILPSSEGLSCGSRDFVGWLCSIDGLVYGENAHYTVPHVAGPITFTAQWQQPAMRLAGDGRYDTAAKIALEAYPYGAAGVIVATGANFPEALGASSLAGLLDWPVVLTETGRLSSATRSAIMTLGAKEAIVVGGEGAVSAAALDEIESIEGMGEVTRIEGNNRYQTAEKIYEYGSRLEETWAKEAIVATGNGFADALSISGYAFSAKVPILLADSQQGLTEDTKELLEQAGINSLLIVGGTSVVPASVDDWASLELGLKPNRLAGDNRYLTSKIIAEFSIDHQMSANGACIATGRNFPDALAGGALAGKEKSVMLLADEGAFEAFDVLRDNSGEVDYLYILGGVSAVPESVCEAAKEAAGLN